MQIEASNLTKFYNSRVVVDGLTFSLTPGKITGFLGPNGSGKSTTMSMMLGLIRGKGQTLFDGKRYKSLKHAPRRIGIYLGPDSFHPRHTVRQHLKISAFTRGVSRGRIQSVIDEVGLGPARSLKIRDLSTGMRQRLGLAAALLSEPEALILDEPANGLDPQMVLWLRDYLKNFARAGGTVLLSSHLIHEVAQFVDDLLVIAQGQLIASESLDAFLQRQKPSSYLVRTSQSDEFRRVLANNGIEHNRVSEDVLEVSVQQSTTFTRLAVANEIELQEIQPVGSNLEDVFLELTSQRSDFAGHSRPTEQAGEGKVD